MEASLILQTAIRSLLINDQNVTDFVPATDIFDAGDRLLRFPCVIIGEDTTRDDTQELSPTVAVTQVFQTLHIWSREPGFQQTKQISGAIQRAVRRSGRRIDFDIENPAVLCASVWFLNSRYIRDPDGQTSHGIMTLEGRIQEPWSVD